MKDGTLGRGRLCLSGLLATLAVAANLAACGGSSDPMNVTVGGSVAGLSTQGLALSNGSDSVVLHAGDTSFVFPASIAVGARYAVQVASQPASRDEFCVVAQGTGTAGSANVTNVSVACHATQWVSSTLAGSGAYGSQDGISTAASFSPPTGLTVDDSGRVFVADAANHKIRRIDASGMVTTWAGSGTAGAANGDGTVASFNMPWRVSAATDGTLYVTDTYSQMIRKITPTGTVSRWSGSGAIGAADGAAASASFYYPFGVAVAADGSAYVADNSNQLIRKLGLDGSVSTWAGSGSAAFADGTGIAASFQSPYGIAVDADGTVYVADTNNQRIRRISPSGVVTTLAGDGTRGSTDGPGASASFNSPQGVAVDGSGNVYVADTGNSAIRKISQSGVVTTLAGDAAVSVGYIDGVGRAARFYFPYDVAVDINGVVYVADWGNLRIRRLIAQ